MAVYSKVDKNGRARREWLLPEVEQLDIKPVEAWLIGAEDVGIGITDGLRNGSHPWYDLYPIYKAVEHGDARQRGRCAHAAPTIEVHEGPLGCRGNNGDALSIDHQGGYDGGAVLVVFEAQGTDRDHILEFIVAIPEHQGKIGGCARNTIIGIQDDVYTPYTLS